MFGEVADASSMWRHFDFVPMVMRTKPGAHIFAAFADENSRLFEFREQRRAMRTEIRQQKIAGARISGHA